MLRFLLVAALCLPGLLQAQDKKKSAEQLWNELYAMREGKEHQFNKFLAEAVKGRTPGKALDIGMGQGRNAVFLAQHGWDVTGVDTSAEGVRQANAQAQAAMIKKLILLMMEWQHIKSMVLSVLVIGSADDRQQIDAGGLRKLSYEFQEEPTTLD